MTAREIENASRPLPPRISGWENKPSADTHIADTKHGKVKSCCFPSLRAHQSHLARTKWAQLNREEAIKIGYSAEDILQEWPTP